MANLNVVNLVNVLAYTVNALATAYLGPNTAQVSEKYQTLITPAGYAFSIWGIIFLAQLIFVLIQLLPIYRATALVQKGVGFKYAVACIFQAAWSPVFNMYEQTVLGMLLIFGTWIFLALIVKDQNSLSDDDEEEETSSLASFWLLKFPFSIHCGWVTAAFLIALNVVFVAVGTSATLQFVASIISLSIVALAALYSLMAFPAYDVVIPAVLSWACYGIHVELGNPKSPILDTFTENQMNVIRQFALVLSILILLGIAIKIGNDFIQSRKPQREEEEQLLSN